MPPTPTSSISRKDPTKIQVFVLVLGALLWIGYTRAPLISSARLFLDSDQAVDGLTVLELLKGHWLWHFPGTPDQGIVPAVLALPGAALVGLSPSSLMVGGIVVYALAVLAIFVLAWQVWGNTVACWSLWPLIFSSTGIYWLSSRLSGGHFTVVAWWAICLLALASFIRSPSLWRVGLLGMVCGVGFYIDRMFLACAIGIFGALASTGFGAGRWYARLSRVPVFVLGILLGLIPYVAGHLADPYDAYADQRKTILDQTRFEPLNWEHVNQKAESNARLLGQCLTRLVSGYYFVQGPGGASGLQSDPSLESLGPVPRVVPHPTWNGFSVVAFCLGCGLLFASALEFFRNSTLQDETNFVRQTLRYALVITSMVTLGVFVLRADHTNTNSYKYLVVLLIPYTLGVGLLLDRFYRSGGRLKKCGLAIALAIPLCFPFDSLAWYSRVGIHGPMQQHDDRITRDPAEAWLSKHPEVSSIFGSYWDVYRLSFLTGGRVRGVPYPDYPDRFPDWSHRPDAERPQILIARDDSRGPFYRDLALREGGKILYEAPGLWIVDWPHEPVLEETGQPQFDSGTP